MHLYLSVVSWLSQSASAPYCCLSLPLPPRGIFAHCSLVFRVHCLSASTNIGHPTYNIFTVTVWQKYILFLPYAPPYNRLITLLIYFMAFNHWPIYNPPTIVCFSNMAQMYAFYILFLSSMHASWSPLTFTSMLIAWCWYMLKYSAFCIWKTKPLVEVCCG